MPETFARYRERVLALLGSLDPVKVQKATPAKLARYVEGVPRRALLRRPEPDKWCVLEILGHLADAELAYGWRLRLVLARSGTPLQWFDESDWASRFHYTKRRADALLRQFQTLRENNLALLSGVPRSEWSACFGMHEKRGRQTVMDFVTMEAAHDLNHLRQIAGILGKRA
jgi:hypothetical protein